ncbi:MAG TPA: hypothetical protein VHW02_07740 [Rhizomicrobium sp.]|jgi:hypothetical protein|nr:hypothetical protein [Rhizomicrobium sp.]
MTPVKVTREPVRIEFFGAHNVFSFLCGLGPIGLIFAGLIAFILFTWVLAFVLEVSDVIVGLFS